MDFRTVLPPQESPFQVDYPDKLLALGSCFAEHMGQRLIDHKFSLQLNPFGILYNPLSIFRALEFLRSDEEIAAAELFLHQDLWHHFAFHGRFSQPDQAKAQAGMTASLGAARQALPHTNRLLITWGTAYAYRHLQQDQIVANCHKLPAAVFERFRLSPEQFVPAYRKLLSDWKNEQPDLEVLLSVSPVRHLRDGLVENQRSKAILLLAAGQLAQELDFVHYFPAYELVLDDLRDYRFYEADLAHPNELAVQYVWEYFRTACFTTAAEQICREIEPVLKAARHRPFHTDTAAYRQFCAQQLAKIDSLEARYGFLDLSKERQTYQGH